MNRNLTPHYIKADFRRTPKSEETLTNLTSYSVHRSNSVRNTILSIYEAGITLFFRVLNHVSSSNYQVLELIKDQLLLGWGNTCSTIWLPHILGTGVFISWQSKLEIVSHSSVWLIRRPWPTCLRPFNWSLKSSSVSRGPLRGHTAPSRLFYNVKQSL